jgi:hypothetical protein
MTKVVLQVVPRGLEDMVVCVFDLPSPAPRLGNGHDVVSRQAVIGATARVIQLFPRVGVDDGEVAPMDRHGLGTTAPEDVVHGAHHGHCREAPIAGACCMRDDRLGGVPKCSALIACGRGVGLTRQDAVETMLADQRTKGLVAGEIIAQEGDAMGCHLRGMGGQPALTRGAFTVLFVMAVLWHNGRWRQGNDL